MCGWVFGRLTYPADSVAAAPKPKNSMPRSGIGPQGLIGRPQGKKPLGKGFELLRLHFTYRIWFWLAQCIGLLHRQIARRIFPWRHRRRHHAFLS